MRHDSFSPLAQLVPVGLLEEQASEIEALKQDLIMARADKDYAVSELSSKDKQVDSERQILHDRESRHQSRIKALEMDIEILKKICSPSFCKL